MSSKLAIPDDAIAARAESRSSSTTWRFSAHPGDAPQEHLANALVVLSRLKLDETDTIELTIHRTSNTDGGFVHSIDELSEFNSWLQRTRG